MDQSNSELIRSTVMDTLKQRFRPEFLNRIDEFVTFKPLGMYTYEYILMCVSMNIYVMLYIIIYTRSMYICVYHYIIVHNIC